MERTRPGKVEGSFARTTASRPSRDANKNAEAAVSSVRSVLAQKVQRLMQQSSLERYFAQKGDATEMLASATAYSSNIATDESTTCRTLRVKRAVHEADTGIRAVLCWLEQLRNCKTQNHCRALGNRREQEA